MYTILGAGLAGISASYHLGHSNCEVFEKNSYAGGHIHSEIKNGYTWDEGPHVSFTKHEYVKHLFADSVQQQYLEYPVHPVNYYHGHWIPHPAQSNLHAVPEPLRTEILEDFLIHRSLLDATMIPKNYEDWLTMAFGNKFSHHFPEAYTQKYWTLAPKHLGTSWVGERVFYPDVDTVKKGYLQKPDQSTHYISAVRYPKQGGYISYAEKLLKDINIHFNYAVREIDLVSKKIYFEDKEPIIFDKLISTLPLPQFVKMCNPPVEVSSACDKLSCSELLLINVEVNHPALQEAQWLYVYDLDKYSTRINFTELLSPANAPNGTCGIQVEVYFSKYQPIEFDYQYYADKVLKELIEMGLIKDETHIINYHTKWVPFANVIFDHDYKIALSTILSWLEPYGLTRELDDLEPMTNWEEKTKENLVFGDLVLAGRFGQWKYYWTDDCVLRGKKIAL